MARSALKSITAEAKHLKKKYPNRFKHLKKSERWSKGYIKQASAIYAKKHHGKSPVGKKHKSVGAKKKVAKRIKSRVGKRVVKQVERKSVERTLTGSRRNSARRRPHRRRRNVVMAGSTRRRRSVGGSGGGSNMLLLAGLGIAAVYFLSRKPTTTTPTLPNLPPLAQTNNYTRNTQSQDILNYAMAAGLATNLIYNLIDRLNNSSDQEVQNIYDTVNTTGDVEVYV
jgi:hypothetical protein